jgi:phosphatidylglycerophosphatase A
MRRFFLTFGYVGLLPKAPGTWGSIAGAVVGYLILTFLTVQTLFMATILLTIIAIKEIDKDEKASGEHDKSEIVIDEVAVIWLAFSLGNETMFMMIFSLIYFRVFDIWKPSIIGRIDRDVKGGLGVMGDDLLAGVVAVICSGVTYEIYRYLI